MTDPRKPIHGPIQRLNILWEVFNESVFRIFLNKMHRFINPSLYIHLYAKYCYERFYIYIKIKQNGKHIFFFFIFNVLMFSIIKLWYCFNQTIKTFG